MTPVRVIVHLRAKTGEGDAMQAALMKEVPVTAARDGAIAMEAVRDLDDGEKFILIQRWRDRAAYDAYLAWRQNSGAGSGALASVLGDMSIQYCETVGHW
jgi:quinol monooxygenase YgiN